MPAGNDPGNGRCDVSKDEVFQPWLKNFKPHDFPYPNIKFYKVEETP